ncbi:MAG: DUF2779 domain-containing protein [Lachnospiraceae bacterium]|nr:DUF2779 domain-containing protein [Lachnospiraceae bacterium]
MLWLDKYRPELRVVDEQTDARFTAGNEVGDLAMGLFGDFTEVTAYRDGQIDLTKMIADTQAEMDRGAENICEASFSYQGLFCSVDILRRENDGWAICEVKSSTKYSAVRKGVVKPVYAADIAFQKYVLEHCGVRVTGTYLICIDPDYVLEGTLDPQRMFAVFDASEEVAEQMQFIEHHLAVAEEILSSPEEPDIDLGMHCRDPYECGFWGHCSTHLPTPSVFDLYRLSAKTAFELYREGLASFEDLLPSQRITNEKQLRQIDFALNDRGTYTEPEHIRKFLSGLSFPLYFLDFETMQTAVPVFPGTRPYAQIPFQYSLHYIEREGGELQHTEFLAESGPDPRRAVAEHLCADIPMNVCVTAFNKAFECTRLKELAAVFPDLSEHLLNISDHIVDLLTPFQSGYYYNRAMGGSFSIKTVLPAICPDDPALDYHNLEGVHHGGEAMALFPKIRDMEPSEREQARRALLKYCELDTLAMVRVWEELVRTAKEGCEDE